LHRPPPFSLFVLGLRTDLPALNPLSWTLQPRLRVHVSPVFSAKSPLHPPPYRSIHLYGFFTDIESFLVPLLLVSLTFKFIPLLPPVLTLYPFSRRLSFKTILGFFLDFLELLFSYKLFFSSLWTSSSLSFHNNHLLLDFLLPHLSSGRIRRVTASQGLLSSKCSTRPPTPNLIVMQRLTISLAASNGVEPPFL